MPLFILSTIQDFISAYNSNWSDSEYFQKKKILFQKVAFSTKVNFRKN